MYLNNIETNELIRIFETQRMSHKASVQLALLLKKWEQNYGIAFVVRRLKFIKAAFLSQNFKGIRKNASGGLYGVFNVLYKMSTSRCGQIRIDRILRVYGRWEATTPCEADYHKFAAEVRYKNYEYISAPQIVTSEELRLGRKIQKQASFNKSLPISDNKVVPFTKSVEKLTIPSKHYELLLDYCPNLLARHQVFFNENIYDVNQFDSCSFGFGTNEDLSLKADVAGQIICLTKDRGLKKRFIANPHRFLQMATSRLQNACASYLKECPESFVYDQSGAIVWVTSQLAQGKKIWSLDLVSATDSFPFEYQKRLLCRLFPLLADDISLWSDIRECLWESPSGETNITYGKGQPMGTAPSFAAFTLAHIFLIRSLGAGEDTFRVIGDDVIFSDGNLAEKYQVVLAQLGVEISSSKSLFECAKAEFAGRIIDQYGAWPSFKAGKLNIGDDPMGLVRQYGLAGLKLYNRKDRKYIDVVCRLPLIGPAHTQENAFLNDIRLIDWWDEYLRNFEDPYPEEVPLRHSIWKIPVTRFEEAQQEIAGFLGSIGVFNSPRLVQHVNSNLREGFKTPFLEDLQSMLHYGTSVPKWDGGQQDKLSCDYVQQVYYSFLKAIAIQH